MVVHILREGRALCGAGNPSQWTESERWVPEDSPMKCTCDACFVELADGGALPLALVKALRKERIELDRTLRALMLTSERLQTHIERIGKQRDMLHDLVEEYGAHKVTCKLTLESGHPACACDCGLLSGLIEAGCVGES